MQRTGTTSFGDFFERHGYKTARWQVSKKNQWLKHWYDGNFKKIFQSNDFLVNQVFEDDPWWAPEFYRYLYHKFPNAKFILFTRNSDDWFKSMLNHSDGKTIGNTRFHCKLYRREKEFFYKSETDPDFKPHDSEHDNLLTIDAYKDHYVSIYETRNIEIIDFFNRHSPKSLLVCDLSDPQKWNKIGKFIEFNVKPGIRVHANRSVDKSSRT